MQVGLTMLKGQLQVSFEPTDEADRQVAKVMKAMLRDASVAEVKEDRVLLQCRGGWTREFDQSPTINDAFIVVFKRPDTGAPS